MGQASKPAGPAEAEIEEAAYAQDQTNDDEISVGPLELGHVLEVHAVDASG